MRRLEGLGLVLVFFLGGLGFRVCCVRLRHTQEASASDHMRSQEKAEVQTLMTRVIRVSCRKPLRLHEQVCRPWAS